MTIDEAIEILEDILTYVRSGDPPEEHDAINLGIEALKYVKMTESWRLTSSKSLLFGETKEAI